LGVTGGIAAYKAADLASKLVQGGADVEVALTESAARFVGEATFEAITQRPVHSSVFEPWRGDWHGHISLGRLADVIVVAPATASTIARLAHGIADDMLGAAVLASTCPLMIVPAMEHAMYHHPATQRNLEILRGRGVEQVGPDRGRLASGEMGDGRMADPVRIVGAIRRVLGQDGQLAGRTVVVTAGGTRERLDPIRFIGNRSSGLMGYGIAQELIDRGARVELITGPTCLATPEGAVARTIESAMELQQAVEEAVQCADALVMTAAVADYRPVSASASKIKKDRAGGQLSIDLVANPDVLAGVDRPGLIKIGFAAETEDLVENARRKLHGKRLQMVVANDAEATIGSASSQATLVHESGAIEALPEMPKFELAKVIVDRLCAMLQDGRATRQ
jgi:phosphopantothenoylcysteine decarboxylase/phosphopantothenate--cysteine ligase